MTQFKGRLFSGRLFAGRLFRGQEEKPPEPMPTVPGVSRHSRKKTRPHKDDDVLLFIL